MLEVDEVQRKDERRTAWKKGMAEGETKVQIRWANSLLAEGKPASVISSTTGLSIEEVNKLI